MSPILLRRLGLGAYSTYGDEYASIHGALKIGGGHKDSRIHNQGLPYYQLR